MTKMRDGQVAVASRDGYVWVWPSVPATDS